MQPKFTHRHYQAIAHAMYYAWEPLIAYNATDINKGVQRSIDYLVAVLSADNPRFDAAKFREACCK